MKLQEACYENAEKKVNGNVRKSENLKCNPTVSNAAPSV